MRTSESLAGTRWLLAYNLNQFAGLQIVLYTLANRATLVVPTSNQPREALADIASRLQLRNLHNVEKGPIAEGDFVFDLTDPQGTPIASFAWTPKQPGAEIVHSVVPFIAVALAGFVDLARAWHRLTSLDPSPLFVDVKVWAVRRSPRCWAAIVPPASVQPTRGGWRPPVCVSIPSGSSANQEHRMEFVLPLIVFLTVLTVAVVAKSGEKARTFSGTGPPVKIKGPPATGENGLG